MRRGKEGGIPPEEFEQAFGDDFWDRPVEERFDLLITRLMKFNPNKENETKHRKDKAIHNRTES